MKKYTLTMLFCLSLSLAFSQLKGLISQPIIEMDNQLFPSYLWANANRGYLSGGNRLQNGPDYYGDSEGQIGVKIMLNTYKSVEVKVSISSPEIMDNSEFSCFLIDQKSGVQIFPEIKYKWSVLAKWKQPKPQNITIKVYANGTLIDDETLIVTVRPINDCPYLFIHRDGFAHDMNFMYAAYVNENHPKIDAELLPEILKNGIIKNVTGYQSDENEVIAQVFSVWQMLRKRGIVYSSLNSQIPHLGNNPFPLVISQHVRTFDDALNGTQANCVDGTVLMASILYRMGLKPLIVTTPNHCFLGVMLDPKTTKMFFVETTMLGMEVEDSLKAELDNVKICNRSILYSLLYDDDYYSFAAATLKGQENFEAIADKVIGNSELYGIPVTEDNVGNVIDALQYQIFEVEKYRKEGLLPLMND
jgi:hypothetical protein